MPKRPSYAPGEYYHLYNRGAHHVSIFREPDNYLFVLKAIKHYCRELQLTLIAYCLMPNHYHFLIRQDGETSAGLLPQRVFNSYTKAYNKRYEHSGTLFEDNYKVRHVQDEPYLLNLCCYIHANPVKDGIVSDLREWPYSNYLEWVEEREGTLVDRAFIMLYFETPSAYREHVAAYLQERKALERLDYLEDW